MRPKAPTSNNSATHKAATPWPSASIELRRCLRGDEDELRRAIASGEIERLLTAVQVERDD